LSEQSLGTAQEAAAQSEWGFIRIIPYRLGGFLRAGILSALLTRSFPVDNEFDCG
jgi:hypothetical protein